MAKRYVISDRAKQHLRDWYDEDFIENAVVYNGSFFGWLFGVFGQAAVTINKKVHMTKRAPDFNNDNWGIATLGHELFHIEQQQEMGWWSFLIRYSLKWRPKHMSDGTSHPMERPAYDRGLEIWNSFASGVRQTQ